MPRSRRSRLPAAGPTLLQKFLLVGFGLAALAAAVAVLEFGLRLGDVGSPHLYEDPFVGFAPGRDLFVLDGDGAVPVWRTAPEKLAFFNEQQFPAAKAPGTYRVFALGGSTTAGRPYDARLAFPAWLERYLRAAAPDRTFEVVNAGGISYASYRIVVLMRELIRHQPDLFVIYTGHNEFLEERTYSDIIHESPALRSLRLKLGGLRSFTLLRQATRRVARSLRGRDEGPPSTLDADVKTRLETWRGLDLYHRDDELRRSILEHFDYNLRQMAAIARAAGVPLILIKPMSNLKDFSPFKSEHGTTVSAEARAQVTELATSFDAAAAAADWALAEGLARQATDLDPGFALSWYELGRAQFALARYDEAERAFIAAKDLDIAPLRALEEGVAIVARVAEEEGLRLVDLPQDVAADSLARFGHRIPGAEYFLDHVHPTTELHGRIAELVLDLLVADRTVAPNESWSDATRQAIFDRLLGELDERYYAQRDLNLAKVLGWSGKLAEAEAPLRRAAEILTDEPEVFLNLGILLQRTGRLDEAAEALERALALDSESAAAWFNTGVVAGRSHRPDDAVRAFEAAIRLQPDYPEAQFNLGRLYLELGRYDEAVAPLSSAVRLRPQAAEIHRSLAQAYRELGRPEEERRSLDRALELAPDDPATLVERGLGLAERNDLPGAAQALSRALEIDPGNSEACYNLGLVKSRQGDLAGAIDSYRAAIAAAPNHVRAHVNLGILLARRGDAEAARSLLERAVELAPGYADAHFNLGVCYDALGRPQAAVDSVRRALAIDPQNPRYLEALDLLTAAAKR